MKSVPHPWNIIQKLITRAMPYDLKVELYYTASMRSWSQQQHNARSKNYENFGTWVTERKNMYMRQTRENFSWSSAGTVLLTSYKVLLLTSEELSEWWFFSSGAGTVVFDKSNMLLPRVVVMQDLGEDDAKSGWLTWWDLLLVPDVWISSPPCPWP